MNQTEAIFTQIGGVFSTPAQTITSKLKTIKAFIFDWDGVFNNATKNENKSSTFNEVDSMGTNLLRYNYFFRNQQLPATAIISGEKNEMAFYFSQREHFNSSYYKIPHKIIAAEHFCQLKNILLEEVCFVFDDVLDLLLAEKCGIRILINRKANPLFSNYVVKNNLVDYVTSSESGNFAVREACEMLIGLTGSYDDILSERTKFSKNYSDYFNQRQSVETKNYTMSNEKIIKG